MAKLILSLDGMVLREYPLTKERTTIGRKAHNDVVIDNLAVSGEHAMIMTILNDSFLEDLGSTNGTLVNGQPIKKHFLQNEDVIELGKYKIKYQGEVVAAAQSEQPDFEKTMVLRAPAAAAPAAAKSLRDTVVDPAQPEAMVATDLGAPAQSVPAQPAPAVKPAPAVQPAPVVQAQPSTVAAVAAAANPAPVVAPAAEVAAAPAAVAAPAASAPPVAPAPAAPASASLAANAAQGGPLGMIQILSGSSAGKELALTKPLTTLGKPGVQVAVIARRPQGYFITHVEGGQFPLVNGKAIDAQAHALADHDVVELAGVKMEFFLKPAA